MRINVVTDLFKDQSIKAIGLIADPDQGKSNTIYHIIKAIQENYDARMYAYGLRIRVEGVQDIHSVEELEKIHDSIVLIDEFPTMFDLNSRRQVRAFEESMRKIFHSNNIVLICGLPHNFNKFLSGLLQAIIFKQCTLVDFVQRSPAERIIQSYSGGFQVQKGNRILAMPKEVALIWDGSHFNEVDVPYMEYGDTKRLNRPVLKPKTLDVESRISVYAEN